MLTRCMRLFIFLTVMQLKSILQDTLILGWLNVGTALEMTAQL